MKVKLYFALAMLLCTVRAYCQASPYSLTIYAPQVFVATGVTGTPIQLNGLTTSTSTVGSSYSVGSITVAGTSLTTATFSVMGSSDNGATYHLLPIYSVTSPLNAPTTSVTVTSGGLYQVNLVAITHVEFVTSGTFTATNLTLTFTASPNGNLSRNGGGSSGTGIGSITWGLPSFMTASPATLTASGSENFTFGTLPVGNGGTGGTGGTGYAYGNGTGPYSYVSTIPVSALASSTININNVPCSLAGSCNTPLICAGTGGTCGVQQINPTCALSSNATTTAAITAGSTSVPVSSTACFSPSGIAFYGGVADAGGFFTWTSISGNTLEGANFYANSKPIYGGTQPSEASGAPVVQVVQAYSGSVNSYPYFAQYQNGGVTYGPTGNGNAAAILNGSASFGGNAVVNGSVAANNVIGANIPGSGAYGAQVQAVDYNYRGGTCGIPDIQYPTTAGGYVWDVVAANEYCTLAANGLAASFFGIRASTTGTGNPGFTIDPSYNVVTRGASTADHFVSGTVNASSFAANTTIGGQQTCLANGTNCPSAVTGNYVTLAMPTAAIAANTCTTPTATTMTGVVTTSAFLTAFSTNPNAVNGWGANGGLSFTAWPTANTLNWSVCNATAASITPGAISLNVGAL